MDDKARQTLNDDVAARLRAVPGIARTTAAAAADGHSVDELARLYGVTRGRIQQRIRQVKAAAGVSTAEEWATFLRGHGHLLDPDG